MTTMAMRSCNPASRTGCFGARRTKQTQFIVRSANQDTQKVVSTLDALDSLLPTEPAKQEQAPAPTSTSQPAASSPASSSQQPAANSSSWINLPPASSQKTNPALDGKMRKAHASFEQVMAFDGLAPEVINGRAAMLGFMAALAGETHGLSLFSQLMAGAAGPAVVVMLLVTAASFAPALRQVPLEQVFGKDKQPASFGPFTADAELRNGRAAMLGLLFLILTEGASSQPFFL